LKIEEVITNRKSKGDRDDKCEKTEHEAFIFIFPEFTEVEFKAGDKHNIEKADSRKQVYGRVLLNEKKPVGADDDPGDDKSDNSGNLKPIENNRNQQDDEQDDREDQDRIGKRRLKFMKKTIPKIHAT
jgi:hypothetical protein